MTVSRRRTDQQAFLLAGPTYVSAKAVSAYKMMSDQNPDDLLIHGAAILRRVSHLASFDHPCQPACTRLRGGQGFLQRAQLTRLHRLWQGSF